MKKSEVRQMIRAMIKEASSKFKKGDRIRAISTQFKGKPGLIISNDMYKGQHFVQMDGKIKGFKPNQIEKLTEARTPWGGSDQEYKIENGVTWYMTPGHGGLRVSPAVGNKKLSGKARGLSMTELGAYWFEEDVQYAIAFYENPDWGVKLAKLAGGSGQSKNELKKIVKQWYPEYFKA